MHGCVTACQQSVLVPRSAELYALDLSYTDHQSLETSPPRCCSYHRSFRGRIHTVLFPLSRCQPASGIQSTPSGFPRFAYSPATQTSGAPSNVLSTSPLPASGTNCLATSRFHRPERVFWQFSQDSSLQPFRSFPDFL